MYTIFKVIYTISFRDFEFWIVASHSKRTIHDFLLHNFDISSWNRQTVPITSQNSPVKH